MKGAAIEQYNAIRNSVGFLDLSDRGKVQAAGPDHISFLHSMFSNDVEQLSEWKGRYGTFLTARGKIVSDFFYYKLPGSIIVDIRRDLIEKTLKTLEKFIVMDELELEDISSQKDHFSLQGPGAGDLLRELFEEPVPSAECAVVETKWDSQSLWLIRKSDLSELGFEIVVPRQVAHSLSARILEKGSQVGLREIGPEARNILRLEAGIPWYGVDMDESRYPLEARLDTAISLTKGCYIGQEVVAKATHVGGVPNLLMRLKLKGQSVPQSKARVYVDENPVGSVTSAVFSPRLDCPIALAYLKKSFARTGAHCLVEVSQGHSVTAEIVDRFIETDAPGRG